MPLPLPNLDTRRWGDLVDEARALIPRYAPAWTDHNEHDPGVTIVELLAWLVEHDLYRVNRVPERHRRKFVALAGFTPAGPQPAQVVISFTPRAGSTLDLLPKWTTVTALRADGPPLGFRTTEALPLTQARIAAVQTFDGTAYADATQSWSARVPFAALAAAADAEPPALLVGLDRGLAIGRPFVLRFELLGGDDRDRVEAEERAVAAACARARPRRGCDGAPEPAPEPEAACSCDYDVAWELYDGANWSPIEAADETRALMLDGAVTLTPDTPGVLAQLGAVAEPLVWLRCRVSAERPDAPPVVLAVAVNAVAAEQRDAARETLRIRAGTVPPAVAPVPGTDLALRLELAPDGAIAALDGGGDGDPEVRVLAYTAAASTAEGELTATLVRVGVARGEVRERHELPGAPVVGDVRVWTLEPAGARAWTARADLDAAGPGEAAFALDAQRGEISFGDGLRGRVPSAGAWIVARYDTTGGAAGNVSAAAAWAVPGLVAELESVTALAAAAGGADALGLEDAAGRAAAALWSHERLVELAGDRDTLDGLDPAAARALPAPARASTLLDFERLALDVPGTRVRRARAWAALDPVDPTLRVPGAVTVVVVSALPAARPQPTSALLSAVARYLDLRRTIGTRVFVVGPDYVEVTAEIRVRARPGRDAQAVADDVRRTLSRFLDPLTGGPVGRGWPFGRDVYRSEVLALVDGCDGVDFVSELALEAGASAASCGNVCVGPLQLVVSGAHRVEVDA